MTGSMQPLIDALNEDLAFEYAAIIQYITFAAMVKGIHRRELHEFFLAEILDEVEHAKYLAEKIVALGGEPVTTPKPFPIVSSPKEMLEAIYEAEKTTVERYTEHARLAEQLGAKDVQVKLEDIIVEEANHRDEVAKILWMYQGD